MNDKFDKASVANKLSNCFWLSIFCIHLHISRIFIAHFRLLRNVLIFSASSFQVYHITFKISSSNMLNWFAKRLIWQKIRLKWIVRFHHWINIIGSKFYLNSDLIGLVIYSYTIFRFEFCQNDICFISNLINIVKKIFFVALTIKNILKLVNFYCKKALKHYQ